MDALKDKQSRKYDYISRYSSFPFYYHKKDRKFVYGITSQMDTDTSFVLHKVTQQDSFDSLSYKYYGRPDLYWVICSFNHIADPYERLWGKYDTLKIPSISNIRFK